MEVDSNSLSVEIVVSIKVEVIEEIDLCHFNSEPSGIYCCDIATVAAHDYSNSASQETAYVGLYHRRLVCLL